MSKTGFVYIMWSVLVFSRFTAGYLNCGYGDFQCSNGKCIPKSKFCDTRWDCEDGSDEIQFNPKRHKPKDGIGCKSWYQLEYSCLIPSKYRQDPAKLCNPGSGCLKGYFLCSNGVCMQKTRFCDGYRNCLDDEVIYNPDVHTAKDGIACRGWKDLTRVCLLKHSQGDADICNTDSKCPPDSYKCYNGEQCISAGQFCDNAEDCRDGTDEFPYYITEYGEYSAEELPGVPCYRCLLPLRYHQNIKEICLRDCTEDSFMCADFSQCISRYLFCDGIKDCRDGSDEVLYGGRRTDGVACRSWTQTKIRCVLFNEPPQEQSKICNINEECADDFYKCSNGQQCIPNIQFCNGVKDCRDESDEIKFQSLIDNPSDGTPCKRGRRVCRLGPSFNQDRYSDLCEEVSCAAESFTCANGLECVHKDSFCDGMRNCLDGSDEIPYTAYGYGTQTARGIECPSWIYPQRECLLPFTPFNAGKNNASHICNNNRQCSEYHFRCSDGSECISMLSFCDGQKNCRDGSDEIPYNGNGYYTYGNGIKCQMPFANRICLLPPGHDPKSYCFDLNRDCDENYFRCASGRQCIHKNKFCDDIRNCWDGSDEIPYDSSHNDEDGIECRGWINLKKTCLLPAQHIALKDTVCNAGKSCECGQFQCDDGTCITEGDYCDGYINCLDGSDEIKFNSTLHVAKDEMACRVYEWGQPECLLHLQNNPLPECLCD